MQRERVPARAAPLHPPSETTTLHHKRRRPLHAPRQARRPSSPHFRALLPGRGTSARTVLAQFHRQLLLALPCRNRPELVPLPGRELLEPLLQPRRSHLFLGVRLLLWLSRRLPTPLPCERRQLLRPQRKLQAGQGHCGSGFR